MLKKLAATAALTLGAVASAHAGPFILAGTDADDHGSVSGSGNQDGWFFMQRALENLAASSELTNANMTVAFLGSTSTALNAAQSAFNLSSLAGSGWSSVAVSTADFANFFSGVGATNINNVSILMMDSGNNVGGGVSGTQFDAYATIIDNFLGNGGGLFSQANGYSWLNVLLPGVVVELGQDSGIELTAAGNAAFPALTNADLSAGPYHNRFLNVGAIPVLAVDDGGANVGEAVIIGAAGGSITDPGGGSVPLPGTLPLVGIALAGLFAARRRG